MEFKKAERKQAKLRLALAGCSGAGKTFSALQIAKGIGGKIAVIDTERGSASLYSGAVDFDVLELTPPFTPERFIDAIKIAENAGYNVIIIDSITHEWNGEGGCLELLDSIAKAKYKGNNWSAWSDITPRHTKFINAMLHSKCHVIATMRSKQATAQSEDNGRKKIVKLGEKVEQRDGIEYEFTMVLDCDHATHLAIATKNRTPLLKDPTLLSAETGALLIEWLNSGVEIPESKLPELTKATARSDVWSRAVVAMNEGRIEAVKAKYYISDDTLEQLDMEASALGAMGNPDEAPRTDADYHTNSFDS